VKSVPCPKCRQQVMQNGRGQILAHTVQVTTSHYNKPKTEACPGWDRGARADRT
jgi:hypothetical protein